MFVTKEGEKVNTGNPKMVYDVYTVHGWWAGTVEYVSLYEYLDGKPATMKVSKHVYNEAQRHGVQVKKYIHPDTNLKQFSANRYPRPWLDMIFDVMLFESEDRISS